MREVRAAADHISIYRGTWECVSRKRVFISTSRRKKVFRCRCGLFRRVTNIEGPTVWGSQHSGERINHHHRLAVGKTVRKAGRYTRPVRALSGWPPAAYR